MNPDVRIAHTNLERAADGLAATVSAEEAVDARYLASLGADAVLTLMEVVADLPPQPRCALARGLLERWGPDGKREAEEELELGRGTGAGEGGRGNGVAAAVRRAQTCARRTTDDCRPTTPELFHRESA